MIHSGEAESRAVVSAVKGVIGQARLDAGANITGLLIDMESADSADSRRHFMCWHLTRMLGPSLTEMVPPTIIRRVTKTVIASSGTIPSRRVSRRPGDPWNARFARRHRNQRGEERFSAV
jgi:hypothetical protein